MKYDIAFEKERVKYKVKQNFNNEIKKLNNKKAKEKDKEQVKF